jgi:hypothetical protein
MAGDSARSQEYTQTSQISRLKSSEEANVTYNQQTTHIPLINVTKQSLPSKSINKVLLLADSHGRNLYEIITGLEPKLKEGIFSVFKPLMLLFLKLQLTSRNGQLSLLIWTL